MKKHVIYFLLIACINFLQGQDLGISSSMTFEKKYGEWELVGKAEYEVTPILEKKLRYDWVDNNWELKAKYVREISSNYDSVKSTHILFKNGVIMYEGYDVCNFVRDSKGKVKNYVKNGYSMSPFEKTPTGEALYNLKKECIGVNYSFDSVLREAETFKSRGKPLNGLTIEYQGCNWHIFKIFTDVKNRVKMIESDQFRVVFTYRDYNYLKIDNSYSINIFPNPSNGIITLDLKNHNIQNGFLSVFNIDGQRVHKQSIYSGIDYKTIDLTHLSNGTYEIQLIIGTELLTQKLFIVE